MKVRDSGMPSEDVWDGFFDADQILKSLGLNDQDAAVVEFGCGYGTFTVAAARLTSGPVVALDIDPAMVQATLAKVSGCSLGNISVVERDFVARGTGLADSSVHWAMLFNILHAENPTSLLREAHRVLRPGGAAAIIHWNHDALTPRGPSLDIRPRPEQCRAWLEQTDFDPGATVALPPYHFGIVGKKRPISHWPNAARASPANRAAR
jgi:SAM-dependent methyltransferase